MDWQLLSVLGLTLLHVCIAFHTEQRLPPYRQQIGSGRLLADGATFDVLLSCVATDFHVCLINFGKASTVLGADKVGPLTSIPFLAG